MSARLSSAAALAWALDCSRIEAVLQAFEASGQAVALIDRCGEAFRLNAAAERLLGEDLHIERRRLVSFDRDATAALDRALRSVSARHCRR